MQLDKTQIIEFLKARGNHDQATQAEQDLPDQVDTDQHAEHLNKLGINPDDLMGGLKGKLGL